MNIERFLAAQQGTYAEALAEVKAGRKTSHWIWWIFPQHRIITVYPAWKKHGRIGFSRC